MTISQVIEVSQVRVLQRTEAVHGANKGQKVSEQSPLRPKTDWGHGFIARDAPDGLVQLVPRACERKAGASVVCTSDFLALIDAIPSRLVRGSLVLDPSALGPEL